MTTVIAGTESQYTNLNTVIKGSGSPAMVMLHGWGQSLDVLLVLGELLAKSRQVHLIDLPGFGKSPQPSSDWDTGEYADCIISYLEEKGLRKVDLLGHSFGGKIALRVACKRPDLVGNLILVASAGMREKRSLPKEIRATRIKYAGKLCKVIDRALQTNLFENIFVPRYGSRDYKNAGPLRNILVKTVNEDLSSLAKEVAVPTLLLWGDRDSETPVSAGRKFHQLIPYSTLIVFPGKDHYLFENEGAHLCAYHILKFLDSVSNSEKVMVNV